MKPAKRLKQIEKERAEIAKRIEKCSSFYFENELKKEMSGLETEARKIRRGFPKADKSVKMKDYSSIYSRAYPNEFEYNTDEIGRNR